MHKQQNLWGISPARTQKVVLPVPWSLGSSAPSLAHYGPKQVLQHSADIDTYHHTKGAAPDCSMLSLEHPFVKRCHSITKECAHLWQQIVNSWSTWGAKMEGPDAAACKAEFEEQNHAPLKVLNQKSAQMHKALQELSQSTLSQNQGVGVLGGDHSAALGLIMAISKNMHRIQKEWGILHIDAHADLRERYQGLEYSHASIMYRALFQNPHPPHKLVQVGVRDYCQEEFERIKQHPSIECFFDDDTHDQMHHGTPWARIVDKILSTLPQRVYISLDIDALHPALCPSTGTPVGGGLSFNELLFLIRAFQKSKTCLGFDLCEVAPSALTHPQAWELRLAARLLLELARC